MKFNISYYIIKTNGKRVQWDKLVVQMTIEKIIINKIGAINNLEVDKFKDNIIIFQGVNASGKTTALAAIYSLFTDIILFNNDNTIICDNSFVEIHLKNGEAKYKLKKNFGTANLKYQLNCDCSFGTLSQTKFFNAYYFNLEKLKYNFTVSQYTRALNFMKKYEFNLFNLSYENASTKLLSGGVVAILNIFYYLSYIPNDSVVLADAIFSRMDRYSVNLLLNLFKKMTHIQFVLAENPYLQFDENVQVNYLSYNTEKTNSFSVNYENVSTTKINEEGLDDKNTIILAKYKKGITVEEDENYEIEYKSIKGQNPCNSILSAAEQYIVSYLNSPKVGEGIIKWGIEDNGAVSGVQLTRKDRDEIRKGIQNQINNITPPLTSDICDLQFNEVLDRSNKVLDGVFVVELKVKHIYSTTLFSTAKGEVYIKKDGVKQKLAPYQVQLEVLRRNGIK